MNLKNDYPVWTDPKNAIYDIITKHVKYFFTRNIEASEIEKEKWEFELPELSYHILKSPLLLVETESPQYWIDKIGQTINGIYYGDGRINRGGGFLLSAGALCVRLVYNKKAGINLLKDTILKTIIDLKICNESEILPYTLNGGTGININGWRVAMWGRIQDNEIMSEALSIYFTYDDLIHMGLYDNPADKYINPCVAADNGIKGLRDFKVDIFPDMFLEQFKKNINLLFKEP